MEPRKHLWLPAMAAAVLAAGLAMPAAHAQPDPPGDIDAHAVPYDASPPTLEFFIWNPIEGAWNLHKAGDGPVSLATAGHADIKLVCRDEQGISKVTLIFENVLGGCALGGQTYYFDVQWLPRYPSAKSRTFGWYRPISGPRRRAWYSPITHPLYATLRRPTTCYTPQLPCPSQGFCFGTITPPPAQPARFRAHAQCWNWSSDPSTAPHKYLAFTF